MLYNEYADEVLFWLLKMDNETAFNTIYERYSKRLFMERRSVCQQQKMHVISYRAFLCVCGTKEEEYILQLH